MKYYKILVQGTFIGVIHSGQFIAETASKRRLLHSDEKHGQFVEYKGILYRDYWMQPVTDNTHSFIMATITEITNEEYNIYMEAIINNETIEEDDEEEEEPIIPIIPEELDDALEFVKNSKISAMSYDCRQTIEAGFDLEIRGETRHFSLTTQDQLNLMSLSTMAQTQQLIPYHADGEECEFYTADEINKIVTKATELKNYNTVYYNSLKTYINALETIEEIAAITYGTPIPEEYKSDVLKVLEY